MTCSPYSEQLSVSWLVLFHIQGLQGVLATFDHSRAKNMSLYRTLASWWSEPLHAWCRWQRHFQSYKQYHCHSSLNGTAICTGKSAFILVNIYPGQLDFLPRGSWFLKYEWMCHAALEGFLLNTYSWVSQEPQVLTHPLSCQKSKCCAFQGAGAASKPLAWYKKKQWVQENGKSTCCTCFL